MPKSSLTHRIAGHLRGGIAEGRWAVGAALPPTRALASEFGVSINTVLGVFRQLEAEDLIECRPRRGGFVKRRPTPPLSRNHSPGSLSPRNASPRAGRPLERTQIGVIRGIPAPRAETPHRLSWSTHVLEPFECRMLEAGYHLSMVPYRFGEPDPMEAVSSQLLRLHETLAGVVCYTPAPGPGLFEALDRMAVPWVTVNRPHEQACCNFVAVDNLNGARLVGRCLAWLGLDRVALLIPHLTASDTMAARATGVLQSYIQLGRPLRGIVALDSQGVMEAQGYEVMRDFLQTRQAPQAIFALGDQLAVGAMRACGEHGLRVPEDVGVIGGTGLIGPLGGTGLVSAEYANLPMTVLAQPMARLGESLAAMLLEMIEQNTPRVPGRFIPPRLILGGSIHVPKAVRRRLALAGEELGIPVDTWNEAAPLCYTSR